jgi:hypothetical protein
VINRRKEDEVTRRDLKNRINKSDEVKVSWMDKWTMESRQGRKGHGQG